MHCPRLLTPTRLVAALTTLLALLVAGPLAATSQAAALGDREMKYRMIDQLGRAPQVLLLGSSRVLKYDPVNVRQLTGRSAFNAGVSSGRPIDAWRYTTHMRSRFPNDMPHLVWGVDVEQFRAVDGEPAAAPLEPTPNVSAGRPATTITRWVNRSGDTFTARGFRSWDFHDKAFVAAGTNATVRARVLRRRMNTQIVDYRRRVYATGAFTELSPYSQGYMLHVLRLANEHGDEPTIFITPMHDTARRDLGPRGYSARKRELLAWLAGLRSDGIRFRVYDFGATSSFRGLGRDYYDGIHMRVENSRRVIRELRRRKAL